MNELKEIRKAPVKWMGKAAANSLTGRAAIASFETVRSTSKSLVVLSPWGDSSPLVLPNVRYRDVALYVLSQGLAQGTDMISEMLTSGISETILVEVIDAGVGLTADVVEGAVEEAGDAYLGDPRGIMAATASVKVLRITMRFDHLMKDAKLRFWRAQRSDSIGSTTSADSARSMSTDSRTSMSSSIDPDDVKKTSGFRRMIRSTSNLLLPADLDGSFEEYLSVEKGWFSPYLFASCRRPIIPRSIMPDFVICTGPYLEGDYKLGASLLEHSFRRIDFCPALSGPSANAHFTRNGSDAGAGSTRHPDLNRVVILLIGIRPHLGASNRPDMWASSKRPDQSAIRYVLLNGMNGMSGTPVTAIVLPAKHYTPGVAWHAKTLKSLWKLEIPRPESPYEGISMDPIEDTMIYASLISSPSNLYFPTTPRLGSTPASTSASRSSSFTPSMPSTSSSFFTSTPPTSASLLPSVPESTTPSNLSSAFANTLDTLTEFVSSIIDWKKLDLGLPPAPAGYSASNDLKPRYDAKHAAVRQALEDLLVSAVTSKESEEVRKNIDADRAGIAMWRIP